MKGNVYGRRQEENRFSMFKERLKIIYRDLTEYIQEFLLGRQLKRSTSRRWDLEVVVVEIIEMGKISSGAGNTHMKEIKQKREDRKNPTLNRQ